MSVKRAFVIENKTGATITLLQQSDYIARISIGSESIDLSISEFSDLQQSTYGICLIEYKPGHSFDEEIV
jgi:hypothetical protein